MSQHEADENTFSWSPQIDKLLASWCDKAKCFEWMHGETSIDYQKRSKIFMVVINILTAVCGLSNIIAGNIIIIRSLLFYYYYLQT